MALLCPNHISAAQSCQLRGSLWLLVLTFIGLTNLMKVWGFDLFGCIKVELEALGIRDRESEDRINRLFKTLFKATY